MRKIGAWAAVIAIPLTVGCATSPIPMNLRQQASPYLDLEKVMKDPQANIGNKVLWGGMIIEVQNLPGGTTAQILEAPLDYHDRPYQIDHSEGRFFARFEHYLDKAIFHPGRRITVFGTLVGTAPQVLNKDENPQMLPIVAVSHYYIWPRHPLSYYEEDPYWAPLVPGQGIGWGPFYGEM